MSHLHHYFKYYLFGLRLGIRNLIQNGFSLGIKKTLGKIFQPINSFSRYPEYECFYQSIESRIKSCEDCQVLDIGSPKLFGLYLAYKYPVHLVLSDVSSLNINEYVQLWNCIKSRAHGSVRFQIMDARHMPFGDDIFVVVYSMSVIEHIDSGDGDRMAVNEMLRVLDDRGCLVVSFPHGSRFVSQYRNNFSYKMDRGSERLNDFFQKIYDPTTVQQLVNGSVSNDSLEIRMFSIQRKLCRMLKLYRKLNENIRGVFGFLSPILACLFCRIRPWTGSENETCEQYTEMSRHDDIYSDLVLVCERARP